jgi:hypothetical protein
MRAWEDPELARALLVLAIRRDPLALETLLHDYSTIAALPPALGQALQAHEGDPMAILQSYGGEVFLVALSLAADARKSDLFTPPALEQLWAFYTGAVACAVPQPHTPERIVSALVDQYPIWLSESALAVLIRQLLSERADELFYRLAHHLKDEPYFLTLLIDGMNASGRGIGEFMPMITQMIASYDLTPQNAADLYVGLLDGLDWRNAAQPVMAQLARTMQGHPELTIDTDAIWRMLTVAADLKDESITRVALRHLTAESEPVEDEGELIDTLSRLFNLLAWSSAARAQLIAWWRGFVRAQLPARLNRLDKALIERLGEGKRPLDDLRMILQSVIAFRKMLGQRTMSQFADDLDAAFDLIQGLTDSFDPSPRRPFSFDPATIRAEIDTRKEELSPQQLQIFANNLKELAQAVANMAEQRSKASLIRRGEDVDRQLMSGEQQPHSAVDVMKWMSGYLTGAQEREDDGEE